MLADVVRKLLGCLFAVVVLAAPAICGEYTVGEGDLLQVVVVDHPDLTTNVRIGPEGLVNFPLVGQVNVRDVPLSRVAALLTLRLADGYLIDPQVSVSILEYRPRRITVMGHVNRPGVTEVRGQITLLELLSRVGGLAPDAGSHAVITHRNGTDSKQTIDLRALLTEGNTALDVEIREGDSVYVEEAGVFFLAGEVRRPGQYRFEEGMTMIRAITLAGGFTDRAETNRLRVIRSFEGAERVFELDTAGAGLEEKVSRGDIVVVNVARAPVFFATGEVKSAGAFRCDPDTTVLKAITLAGGFTDAAAKNRIRIIRRVNGQEKVFDKVGLDELVQPDDVLVVPKSFF